MKNLLVVLFGLAMSAAASASPMTSSHSVSAPLGGSGTGSGTGTWTCALTDPFLNEETHTINETQTTTITAGFLTLSSVQTTQDLVITRSNVSPAAGSAEVTSCTNLGGIYNGCDEIDINVPTALDSVALDSTVACGSTHIDAQITIGTQFGNTVTDSDYDR